MNVVYRSVSCLFLLYGFLVAMDHEAKVRSLEERTMPTSCVDTRIFKANLSDGNVVTIPAQYAQYSAYIKNQIEEYQANRSDEKVVLSLSIELDVWKVVQELFDLQLCQLVSDYRVMEAIVQKVEKLDNALLVRVFNAMNLLEAVEVLDVLQEVLVAKKLSKEEMLSIEDVIQIDSIMACKFAVPEPKKADRIIINPNDPSSKDVVDSLFNKMPKPRSVNSCLCSRVSGKPNTYGIVLDRNRIIYAYQNLICLCDMAGNLIHIHEGPGEYKVVTPVCVRGALIAAGLMGKTESIVCLWDVFSHNYRAFSGCDFKQLNNYVLITEDSKRLIASSGSSDVLIWNLEDSTMQPQFVCKHSAHVSAVAMLDGERFISGCSDGFVYAWNTKSGVKEWEKEICRDMVPELSISPNKESVFVWSKESNKESNMAIERMFYVLDIQKKEVVKFGEQGRHLERVRLVFSAKYGRLVSYSEHEVIIWCLSDRRVLGRYDLEPDDEESAFRIKGVKVQEGTDKIFVLRVCYGADWDVLGGGIVILDMAGNVFTSLHEPGGCELYVHFAISSDLSVVAAITGNEISEFDSMSEFDFSEEHLYLWDVRFLSKLPRLVTTDERNALLDLLKRIEVDGEKNNNVKGEISKVLLGHRYKH